MMKRLLMAGLAGWAAWNGSAALGDICYVSTTGNDGTAVRGNPLLPSLTITNAAALSQAGDTIQIGAGTFSIGTNTVALDQRNITGAGKAATFIEGTGGTLLSVQGDAALEGFTITSTILTGAFSFPVGSSITNHASAAVTMTNVNVYGQSDGLLIAATNAANPAITFRMDNCAVTTTYDAVIFASTNAGSTFVVRDSVITVTNNPSLFGQISRCVFAIGNGSVTSLTNNVISASDGLTETYAIQHPSGTLNLSCNDISAQSDTGLVYRLTQTGGSTVAEANFSAAQVNVTGGSIAYTGSACVRTFYIDVVDGNDFFTGQTQLQPWKLHPYMKSFAGSYTHVAGDRFIFKGGVTWPKEAFQMAVSAGGTAAAGDYYGVDTSWFAGSEWSMPVWDFENVQIGTGFSSSAGVLVQNAQFVTFDRIDIKRHRSPVSFGSSSVSLFGTTSDVTFTNVVVRDWSVAGTGVGSDAGGGIQNYSSGRNFLIVQSLLHQDNEANKCGYAAKGINEVAYTEVRNTPNAVFGYTLGHHNHIHHIPNCTDTSSHPNAMATTGSGTSTYANLIHDLASGVSCIFVSPDWTGGFSVDLVYNNVCYNVGLQAPIQLDTGGQNTAKIGIRAYNNVLVANGGGYCIRVVERGTGAYGTLDVRNCQLIATGTALGYNNPGIGNGNVTTVTLQNNLTMTPAAATAAGYVTGNNFAPTAVTSPTVRAGVDLSTVFNVAIDGTLRPAGLWDVAAYQFTAGGITNPPPPPPLMPDQPVGLSPAEGEVNVSLRPVLTASAFSDPQGSAQIASQWIVLQSGSVIRDSGAYVAATSYPIPTDLANFTAYGWQARYQNAFGLWSPYSAELGFTTTNVVIDPPPPPPSTNPPPPPPPPGGVRLRVTNMKAGKVRAK